MSLLSSSMAPLENITLTITQFDDISISREIAIRSVFSIVFNFPYEEGCICVNFPFAPRKLKHWIIVMMPVKLSEFGIKFVIEAHMFLLVRLCAMSYNRKEIRHNVMSILSIALFSQAKWDLSAKKRNWWSDFSFCHKLEQQLIIVFQCKIFIVNVCRAVYYFCQTY